MEGNKTEIISGLVIFFLGIGLLCFTFFLAFIAFIDPGRLFSFGELIPISGEGQFGGLFKVGGYIIAVLLLWIMASIGGKVTRIGMDMYRLKEKKLTETP